VSILTKFTISVILIFGATNAYSFQQTYETCSKSALLLFLVIDNYVAGEELSLVKSRSKSTLIKNNAAKVYSIATSKGISEAIISIHINNISCMQEIKAPLNSREKSFQTCAKLSAISGNVLAYLKKGMSKEDVSMKLKEFSKPQSFNAQLDQLFSLEKNNGIEQAALFTSRQQISCNSKIISPAKKLEAKYKISSQILKLVMAADGILTKEMHQKFWKEVNKHGAEDELNKFRKLFKTTFAYQRELFDSAIISYEQ
jgi:hypothetical protein